MNYKIKFFLITVGILLIFFGTISFLFFQPVNTKNINPVQKVIISNVNKKWERYVKSLSPEKQNIPDYDTLLNQLNPIELYLVKKIFSINPSTLGFLGPYYGIQTPGQLTSYPNKKYNIRDIEIETGINYLSPVIAADLEKMNQAMQKDIGKQLDVENAYRTPGLSAKLFLYYLEKENGWSMEENAKWIAMPGYSEHNSYDKTAIDFINQEGISGEDEKQVPEDFENLPEFKWLEQNANKFNLFLSYPKDNNLGVAYEPWHWHWEKK